MIQEHSVKIIVEGKSSGSGCLFQPNSNEFTYVLTAKHCISEDGEYPTINDIKILQDKHIGTENYLDVVDYFLYPNDEHDLAIILVKKINDLSNILVSSPKRNDNLLFYGYPHILSDDGDIQATHIKGEVERIAPSRKFVFKANDNLITFTEGTYEITRGFSGAGVYQEYDNHVILKGIVSKLGNPSGAYSLIIAEDIMNFNKILDENHLAALYPSNLLNFDFYSMAFDRYGNRAKPSFLSLFREGVIGISPKYIIDNLGGDLFLPLEKKEIYAQNLNEDELWCGWSRLLTYIFLHFDTKIDDKLIKDYLFFGESKVSEKNKHTIKFFYTNKFDNMNDCVKQLYDDDEIYSLINFGDYIIINSKNRFGSKRVNDKQIKRVVKSIDEVRIIEKGINIDDPNIYKNMSIFHLDAFDTRFEEEDIEFCENTERNDRIKKGVKEVFKYVSEE